MPTGIGLGLGEIVWPIGFGLLMTAPVALHPFRLRLPSIRRAGCPIERTINRSLKHPEGLRRHPHYAPAAAEIRAGKHNPNCRECWALVGLNAGQIDAIEAFRLSDATLSQLQRSVRFATRTGRRTDATELLGEKRLEILRATS